MEYSYVPSDEALGVMVPIVVYWVCSGIYMMLGSLTEYRLHSRRDEDMKNLVSKRDVAKGVLLQQLVQAAVAFLMFRISRSDDNMASSNVHTTPLVIVRQFFVGMFVLDTWQYFWHRYMHTNKFLYRHVHSWHHRLVVPYAFGTLYNHPLEGLIMDTLGGAAAFVLSGMSARTSIFFFSFSTIKSIDEHCGMWLPGNILQMFFWNNTAYHDVHHQLYGLKYNFAQPFFTTWDRILGTHMPYTLEKRPDGGLEARPVSKR